MCTDKPMGLSETYPEQTNDLMMAALSVVEGAILVQLIARSYVSFALHRKFNGDNEADEN